MLRATFSFAVGMTMVAQLAGAALAADCVDPLPPGSDMSAADYRSALARLDRRLAEVSTELRRVEARQEQVRAFKEYQMRGYTKRTGRDSCGPIANEALSVYKEWQAARNAGEGGRVQKARYRELKKEYEGCMDEEIRKDPGFRKLLESDPGAAAIAARGGSKLYSFATANGRYQELKTELIPADQGPGFMKDVIEPMSKQLSSKRTELAECLSQLSERRNALVVQPMSEFLNDYLHD